MIWCDLHQTLQRAPKRLGEMEAAPAPNRSTPYKLRTPIRRADAQRIIAITDTATGVDRAEGVPGLHQSSGTGWSRV